MQAASVETEVYFGRGTDGSYAGGDGCERRFGERLTGVYIFQRITVLNNVPLPYLQSIPSYLARQSPTLDNGSQEEPSLNSSMCHVHC
jgi:hypothetical protein